MTNNNQNQMGPPPPSNYPHQAVALYPNPYLFQGWNNFSYHVPPDQPIGSNQPPGNGINHHTPPSKPRKSQSQKMENPKSKNLNHFQKCHLYMGFESIKRYPTEYEMRYVANDMNVEYEAVVEYFRDLHSSNWIPLPSDPFAGMSHNQSNNNQFLEIEMQETSNAAPNQSIPDTEMQAAPQPRAQKRASTTVPEFASKCRRQDPEPME